MSSPRPKDVLSRVFDEQAVLLALDSGKYFGMNEVATFVWEQLSSPKSFVQLLTAIVETFDVDEATARTDLEGLASDFIERGLVERSATSA